LVWKGFHPEQLHLEDVQKYADVKAHDTIVTSGYSLVFPEGLPIGRVEAFEIPQGAFTYSIQVSLFQNLNTIEQVYVIGHNYKNEKDQLEKQAEKYE
jgi:rod shape-determining protein MreC